MEIFKIIAFSPPLSPSSLSFIPSLSSWCRIKSSKTGQWRFKLSKLINYSRKYGVYTRPWLPYIFVKNVLKSASRLKKCWKTRSGQSTELLRLSVQKSKLSTTNWIFVECFLKLSSSCFSDLLRTMVSLACWIVSMVQMSCSEIPELMTGISCYWDSLLSNKPFLTTPRRAHLLRPSKTWFFKIISSLQFFLSILLL